MRVKITPVKQETPMAMAIHKLRPNERKNNKMEELIHESPGNLNKLKSHHSFLQGNFKM